MLELLLVIAVGAPLSPQEPAAPDPEPADARPMVSVPECGSEAPCDPPPHHRAATDKQEKIATPVERGVLEQPGVAPALASAAVCVAAVVAAIAFALPTSLLSIPLAALALVVVQPAAAAIAAYLVTPDDLAPWPAMLGGAVGDLLGLVAGVAALGIVGGVVGAVAGGLNPESQLFAGQNLFAGLVYGFVAGASLGGLLGGALGAFLGVNVAEALRADEAVGVE